MPSSLPNAAGVAPEARRSVPEPAIRAAVREALDRGRSTCKFAALEWHGSPKRGLYPLSHPRAKIRFSFRPESSFRFGMIAILLLVPALFLVVAVAGIRRTEQQVFDAIARGDMPAATTAAASAMQRLQRAGVVRERDGRLEIDASRADAYHARRRRHGILLAVVAVILLITSAVVTKRVLDHRVQGGAVPAGATAR